MANNEINLLTKEAIYTSLLLLLADNDFSDISITDITKKAGVSRMAYYRNYDSKEAILINYLDDLFSEYYEDLLKNETKTIYDLCLYFFKYFDEEHLLIEVLIKAGLTNELLAKFSLYLEQIAHDLMGVPESPQNYLRDYQTQFLVGGFWNILLQWISDERPQSSETMAKVVDDLGLSLLTKFQT